MDSEARKLYFNRCDPAEPLKPGDGRYVEIDGFGAPRARPRGPDVADDLAARIEAAVTPLFQAVTAVPGAGLTTELRRAADRLSRRDGAHLRPVFVEARGLLDLTSPLHGADVALAILAALERELADVTADLPGVAYLDALWARWGVGGAGAAEAVLARPPLRQELRRAVLGEESRFVAALRTRVAHLQQRTRVHGRSGLLVCVDSLETLRARSGNAREVWTGAERLFRDAREWLDLGVHTICTAPLAVTLSPEVRGVRVLPMVAIDDHAGEPLHSGRAALAEVVRRRVPEDVLRAQLGSDRCDARVERLIEASGGSPRELLGLVRAVVAAPVAPSSDAAWERLLHDCDEGRGLVLTAEERALLARAEREGLAGLADADRFVAARLLAAGLLLPYDDGRPRWRTLPAVARNAGRRVSVA